MKVHVTAQHITEGKQRHSRHCMIADAVKAAVPEAQYILVDLQSIRFSDPATRKRFTYFTPPVAQQALLRFDKGDKTIAPFTFTLTRSQVRVMGWRGQRDPERTRMGKRYKATGKQAPVVAYMVREFGLRKLAL